MSSKNKNKTSAAAANTNTSTAPQANQTPPAVQDPSGVSADSNITATVGSAVLTPVALDDVFAEIGAETGVDANLLRAIATVKSKNDPWYLRYCPTFSRFSMKNANPDTDVNTEMALCQCELGVMGVKGAFAREDGYTGKLTALLIPENGIRSGAMRIAKLLKRFGNDTDAALAAYDTDIASKVNDRYTHQAFISAVKAEL